MNKKLKILTAFGFLLAAMVLFIIPVTSQENTNPTAFLVYYDDDFELEVFDSSGEYLGDVYMGMELFKGSTIKTYNTSAEIKLKPNGSILRLSENSVFQIEAFQNSLEESNDFSLFNGKLRVIAARAGFGYENYSIITQSAVCGVRGTDFVIDSIGVLAVMEGKVEFSSLLNGDTIDVTGGQWADVFADTFSALNASADKMNSVFRGMDFKGAEPSEVPGHQNSAAEQYDEEKDAQEAEEPSEDKQEEKDSEPPEKPVTEQKGSAAANITGRIPEDSPADNEEEPATFETGSESGLLDGLFGGLRDIFALEIGSININGITYAKAVVHPKFEIGKFKARLYLPVIYQDNPFAPSTWYRPAGNNEWSFGTDKNKPLDITLDIVNDIFLKIEYLQWGDNGDDFYLKFGNLNNMTIGYGILMNDFTNNFEFPAVRKIGVNTGISLGKFGFEAVLDNAAFPTIIGGRMFLKPLGIFPINFGISAIADINPDSEVESEPELWNPMILNGGVDIGFPISALRTTIFAEAAGMIYRDTSWHLETIYNKSAPDFLTALNNYGVSAGLFGDILSFIEYRFEYRLSKGIFKHTFYDNNYLADKTAQYNQIKAFISNPLDTQYQALSMGVYGDLSLNFFDALTIKGGYLWPWEVSSTGYVKPSDDDYFILKAEIMPDVIPLVGIYGSVSYTRQRLVHSINQAVNGTETFTLINPDSLLSGEIVYPFDPSLDIAVQFSTTFKRVNEQLEVDASGEMKTEFAISLDMRVHF